MHRTYSLLLGALALVAACGNTVEDRALTGGAIGAGAGLVGGALVGGSLAKGAIIGGLAGAAAGGLTRAEDFNLGEPVYRRR